MKTLHFNTSINCGSCIAAVTPALNNIEGIANWNVDTNLAHKPLTLEVNDTVTEQQIIDAVTGKGFTIEKAL